ncbi:Pyridoxal phosphate homeostasis protein [Aphelenchoides besseyi]|nr:Pyridoxal phosphate homeostasis protein [Aphelenchoides besseyi]KAI6194527.1 Pyridoxal phosphate homeostasis protein [Aphelenchoides besseyi]
MSSILSVEIVQQNLRTILENVIAVSERANRSTPRLVAVGKTFPASLTEGCYDVGQRHFGENYVQELKEKSEQLATSCPEIRWHFIGRLQSSKIKKICEVRNLWCVETIATQKHCELFQKHFSDLGLNLNIFVQVNTSGEEHKGGVKPKELSPLVSFILQKCPNLDFKGLMTIGSYGESQNNEKNSDFELLCKVRSDLCEQLDLSADNVELSMGMTNDYELAIRYGSTNIRVGSAIFGARHYPNKST